MRVSAPDMRDNCSERYLTKNMAPKSPYTIEGIPDNVSAVILTTPTSLLPLPAYSVRYIAENIPAGTEIKRERTAISSVFISAGMRETLSLLYSQAKRSGVR